MKRTTTLGVIDTNSKLLVWLVRFILLKIPPNIMFGFYYFWKSYILFILIQPLIIFPTLCWKILLIREKRKIKWNEGTLARKYLQLFKFCTRMLARESFSKPGAVLSFIPKHKGNWVLNEISTELICETTVLPI